MTIKLRDLKEWVNKLPESFLDYSVVNGEEAKIDEDYYYRVDRPIVALGVDEDTGEILILNQLEKEITKDDLSNE